MENFGRQDHHDHDLNNSRRIRDLEQQIELLRTNIARLSNGNEVRPEHTPQLASIQHPGLNEDFTGFASHTSPAPHHQTNHSSEAYATAASSVRARRVRERIRQRRLREKLFGTDLFADPAWDMMLDLYAAQLEGNEVSVSSLCIAAAVPTTTALRWIKLLSQRGWLLRSHDPGDGRRVNMHLSGSALEKLDRYFDSLRD